MMNVIDKICELEGRISALEEGITDPLEIDARFAVPNSIKRNDDNGTITFSYSDGFSYSSNYADLKAEGIDEEVFVSCLMNMFHRVCDLSGISEEENRALLNVCLRVASVSSPKDKEKASKKHNKKNRNR